MNIFKYYMRNDPNKEAIGYVLANNLFEAEILASKIKKLPKDEFLKIFKMEKK